jgi:hypothetical protein
VGFTPTTRTEAARSADSCAGPAISPLACYGTAESGALRQQSTSREGAHEAEARGHGKFRGGTSNGEQADTGDGGEGC